MLYAIGGRNYLTTYNEGERIVPTQEKIPINGLLEGYETMLKEMGYCTTTRFLLVRRAELILRRHQDQGLEHLDKDIVNRYVQEIDERYFNGKMARRYHERAKREIERFINYVYTGKSPALPSVLRGATQKLTPGYERIAEDFLSGDFHPNTRSDMRWTTHKYFAWLEDHGFTDLRNVGPTQIQKFLLEISERYSPSTLFNVRLYLKKLYAFLWATGRSESDYCEYFSFNVNRNHKVFPTLPRSDIAKLLAAIDRTTVKGKRDYAIMMLGTVLGLRACDVAALKLKDIDWMRGEIRVLQSKTLNPVVLPLTQDVGEALKDYILNARPESDAEEIFLRIKTPHTPFADASSVGEVYEDCCIAAGLSASKKFHNLRRALGTSMVSNGVSVYDVAQVFGDGNVESTKPYISADTEHLKLCALPFDGIAPGRR